MKTFQIPQNLLPDALAAKRLYETVTGGHLKEFSKYGVDPIEDMSELRRQREAAFKSKFPCFVEIFNSIHNAGDNTFESAVRYFLHLTIMACDRL